VGFPQAGRAFDVGEQEGERHQPEGRATNPPRQPVGPPCRSSSSPPQRRWTGRTGLGYGPCRTATGDAPQPIEQHFAHVERPTVDTPQREPARAPVHREGAIRHGLADRHKSGP
jgi:hypothetical protein